MIHSGKMQQTIGMNHLEVCRDEKKLDSIAMRHKTILFNALYTSIALR